MGESTPLVIIGAGGAGLVAAARAAALGVPVLLLERNRKPGIKLLISGGGKCNITHSGPMEELRGAFPVRQARFLKHAFHAFSNEAVLELLAREGVATYTRENGRVFPVSGRAGDVVEAFTGTALRAGAVLRPGARATAVLAGAEGVRGVALGGEEIATRRVLVATGGVSYPRTGTTGDGYGWARALGHTVVPLRPALAPVGVAPALPADWRGVAVRGGRLTVRARGKVLRQADGDLLFTHEGISGPAALEVSNAAARVLEEGGGSLVLDFFPALDHQALDRLLQRRLLEERGRMLETLLYARPMAANTTK